MPTKHWFVTAILIAAAFAVVAVSYMPSPAAPPVGGLEYKVVPAKDLGIIEHVNGAVFNYPEMEKKLNELAADGWKWREYVPVQRVDAVVFVRRR